MEHIKKVDWFCNAPGITRCLKEEKKCNELLPPTGTLTCSRKRRGPRWFACCRPRRRNVESLAHCSWNHNKTFHSGFRNISMYRYLPVIIVNIYSDIIDGLILWAAIVPYIHPITFFPLFLFLVYFFIIPPPHSLTVNIHWCIPMAKAFTSQEKKNLQPLNVQ